MQVLWQLLSCSGFAQTTGATIPSDCCGSLQVQVNFDSSLLAVPSQSSCTLGTDWQSAFVCNAKGSNSSVFFNSVDQSVNSAKQGTAVSIATITFQALQVRTLCTGSMTPAPAAVCPLHHCAIQNDLYLCIPEVCWHLQGCGSVKQHVEGVYLSLCAAPCGALLGPQLAGDALWSIQERRHNLLVPHKSLALPLQVSVCGI